MFGRNFRKLWPHGWLWAALGIFVLGDAIWLAVLGDGVIWPSEFSAELGGAFVLALVVPRLTQNRRLYAAAMGLLFVLSAWPALRLYNHLTMTTGLPMQDHLLAGWDEALGLNWLSYTQAMDGQHLLVRMLATCYTSLTTVSCIFFVALVFAGDIEEAENFLILFFVAAIVISSLGAFFPANGATAFYAPTKEQLTFIPTDVGKWFVVPLHEVRTEQRHIFDMNGLPGLTAFPSFHSAMGVIILYCSRTRSYLFGPAVVFVSLMTASAVIFGGHYFVDIFAGIVTMVVLLSVLRFARRGTKNGMVPSPAVLAAAE